MNVIGFIKSHDSNVDCSKDLNDLLSNPIVDSVHLGKVISYLEQGIPLLKFMGDVYDSAGNSLGRMMYLTDGEWLWPSYYSRYLQRYPNILVPQVFLDHIDAKKNVHVLTPDEKLYAEYILIKLLKIKIPHQSTPKVKSIQYLIDARGVDIISY